VAPHYYQTWPFYVACAAVLLALAIAYHVSRLRVAERLQALRSAANLAEQRARISQDIHDDIGANVTNIALLNEVVRANPQNPELARRETEKIASITAETLDSLSELVWVTNPNYDSLANLVGYLREYVARFMEPTRITTQLDFPKDVPSWPVESQVRRHLLLIVKEALRNVLKHSGASRVAVGIRLLSTSLELTVSDNGHGFSSQPPAHRAGLVGMHHRVAALGGSLKIDSPPGAGVTVHVQIPLPPPSATPAPWKR
jgi:signal transduction histidine kinase